MPKVYPHKKFFQRPNIWLKNFLSFLFPPRCVRCGQIGIFLCEECLFRLSRNNELINDDILAVFDYCDPSIKKAIRYLKYRGVLELSEIFGRELYQTFITAFSDEFLFETTRGKIVVIPVPLSRQRRRERGFNQAEELARHFCAFDPKSFELRTDLIFKIKNTPSQVSCRKRSDRLQNLRDAFATSRRKKITGKTILLIDDVTTTGATIGEIKKVLLKKGAHRVLAIVVAHG